MEGFFVDENYHLFIFRSIINLIGLKMINMKIASGVLMLIGIFYGIIILVFADSAPQQIVSLVPIIGGYVLGRALENFMHTDHEILRILSKLLEIKTKETSENEEIDKEPDFETESVAEDDVKILSRMITNLKSEEMIVRMKEDNKLLVINKSDYDSNKHVEVNW